MSTKSDKPRLGRGLSSLMGTPVPVKVPDAAALERVEAKRASLLAALNTPPKPAGKPMGSGAAAAPKPLMATPRDLVGGGAARPSSGAAATPTVAAKTSDAREQPTVNVPATSAASAMLGATPRGLVEISVSQLVRGRYQPRREMDEASLQRLAASIRASGVMQPIAVREIAASDERCAAVRTSVGADVAVYEVVAGERRWRAAMLAGLSHIPAVASPLTDREAAEWAIVENVQREDLNTMDRAWGLKNLVEGFGLQHAEVAERVGLDRSSVTNLLRLTELEMSVQGLLREGALGLGHGKALLSAGSGAERERLAKMAASQKWTVRRLERAVGALGVGSPGGGQVSPKLGGTVGRDPLRADAAIRELEKQLGEHLGTRVRIMTGASRTKGRVVMDFYSLEHFDGLMGLMGVEIKS